jgi:hypothetical protein
MTFRQLILASAVAAVIAVPATAVADSQLSTGGTGTTAQASLDFRITMAEFVYFRVGTDVNGTVDRVDFDITGLSAGNGTPVNATGGNGDGVDGILTVELRSNASGVQITAGTPTANLVGLTATNLLPFDDITAADGGNISVPDFGATVNIPGAGPYDLNDNWTYTYDNTSVYAPDQYNGRVTYTVTTL